MIPTIKDPLSLRDAMYHLALSKPAPDAELLEEFVGRYPEHAAALTEFAVALALDALGAAEDDLFEPTSQVPGSAVSKAMSRFQNRLYAAKEAQPTPRGADAENPFASLPRSELRALAERLNGSSVFVMKLRDRQILPNTMSQGFQRRVAEELRAPIQVVIAHFAAQSQIQPRTHFKAYQKPEASAMQTFEEAVRSSGLTPEQQKYLLSL